MTKKMIKMVGATLQGKTAWFTIENLAVASS